MALIRPFRLFILAAVSGLLVSCGGGGSEVQVRPGLYAGSRWIIGFDLLSPLYQLLWTDDGEVWIADSINLNGSAGYFAHGRLSPVERVGDQVSFRSTMGWASIDSGILSPATLSAKATIDPSEGTVRYFEVASPTLYPYEALWRERTDPAPIPTNDYRSTFDYDRPAEVSELARTWISTLGQSSPMVTLRTDSAGGFEGANAVTGCAFSGKFTPHASGKNIFSVRFSLSACPDSVGEYAGVAYVFRQPQIVMQGQPGGFTNLKILAMRADRARAFHLNLAPE